MIIYTNATSVRFGVIAMQANSDIRTIHELLGHSDMKTTMIYTHTVNEWNRDAKSFSLCRSLQFLIFHWISVC